MTPSWGKTPRRGFTALAAAALLTLPALGAGAVFADELSGGVAISPEPSIVLDQSLTGDDAGLAKHEREQRGHDDGAGHALRVGTDSDTYAKREREQRGNDDGTRHAFTLGTDSSTLARERENRGGEGPRHG